MNFTVPAYRERSIRNTKSCPDEPLGNEPRRILAELCELRMMDVVLPTRESVDFRRRCVNTPTEHQQILLGHLGLRLPKMIQTDL